MNAKKLKENKDNQKFLRILSTLEQKEIQDFQGFLKLDNPAIDYQKQCLKLLNQIVKKADKRKNEFGQAFLFFPEGFCEKIALQAFGQADKTDKSAQSKMSYYLSFLNNALRVYIGQFLSSNFKREIIHKEYMADLLYLEFLQKQGLTKLFEQFYKKLTKVLGKEKKSEHLYHTILLKEQLYSNHLILNQSKRHGVNLDRLFELTSKYNFLTLIKIACTQLNLDLGRGINRKNIATSNEKHFNFHQEIKKFVEDELLQLYYQAYVIFTENDSIENIQKLIKNIPEHQGSIGTKEIQDLFKFVENICLEKTRRGGGIRYRELLFNIYQYLDELDLLIKEKIISIRLFLNIVNESAKNQQFEWGHQFIEKYHSQLPLKAKEKIPNVGRGLLLFENKEYQASIDILDNYNMYFEDDPRLENNRNILLIKAFYETKQFDYVLPRIEMHLNFLRKTQKLTSAFTIPNRLFLQILNKLVKLNIDIKLSGLNKKQIQQKTISLKHEINNSEKRIDNKTWLLIKIEELK